jgi:hypothetical protein
VLLGSIELSKKYVQKRKLRANFIKNGISTSQGKKRSLVGVLSKSKTRSDIVALRKMKLPCTNLKFLHGSHQIPPYPYSSSPK